MSEVESGVSLEDSIHRMCEKHPDLMAKAFDKTLGEANAENIAIRRQLAASRASEAAASLLAEQFPRVVASLHEVDHALPDGWAAPTGWEGCARGWCKWLRAALDGAAAQTPQAPTVVYEQQPEEAIREARRGGSYTVCKQCKWETNGYNGALNHAPSCIPCECWEWPAGLFEEAINGHHKDCPKLTTSAASE